MRIPCSTGVWLAAACLGVTTGCYTSPIPLGPSGEVRVDASLVGSWQCFEEGTDERAILTVARLDDFSYAAVWADGEGTLQLRAHLTREGTRMLLNVKDVTSESWMFVRHEFDEAGRLKLSIVDSKAVNADRSAQEIVRDVRERAGDDTLYALLSTCSRTERTSSN